MIKVKVLITMMLVLSVLGIVGCNALEPFELLSNSEFENAIEVALNKEIDEYKVRTLKSDTYMCDMLWYYDNFEISHNCELYSTTSSLYLYKYEDYRYYEHDTMENAREMFDDDYEQLTNIYGTPTIEYQGDDFGYFFFVTSATDYCEERFNNCSECLEVFESMFDIDNTSVYEGYYYSGSMVFYFYHFTDSDSELEEVNTFLDELGLPYM